MHFSFLFGCSKWEDFRKVYLANSVPNPGHPSRFQSIPAFLFETSGLARPGNYWYVRMYTATCVCVCVKHLHRCKTSSFGWGFSFRLCIPGKIMFPYFCQNCRGAQKAHRAVPNEALYGVLRISRLITWTYLHPFFRNSKGLS